MPAAIRDQLFHRVLIADGAMGTMLQGFDLDLDDFEGYEGCNEVLNRSRPDVVAAIHRAYLAAGADCIETAVNVGKEEFYEIVVELKD